MTRREARKLKVGDRLNIGGDIRGYVERINKKSITFREADWLGIWPDRDCWNLPWNGRWDDIYKEPGAEKC